MLVAVLDRLHRHALLDLAVASAGSGQHFLKHHASVFGGPPALILGGEARFQVLLLVVERKPGRSQLDCVHQQRDERRVQQSAHVENVEQVLRHPRCVLGSLPRLPCKKAKRPPVRISLVQPSGVSRTGIRTLRPIQLQKVVTRTRRSRGSRGQIRRKEWQRISSHSARIQAARSGCLGPAAAPHEQIRY